jgi:hypothetical protein
MSIAATPRRRLAVGVLIVAVLAVLAVGSLVVMKGGGDAGGVDTAAGGGVSTTVVAPVASPPELKNTGEDWDQIVRSISQYQAWLFTHPKPELLDSIMLTSYEGYSQHQLGLTNLATKGWRYDPPFRPITVDVVRLQDRPRADLAVVFVRSTSPANRVVDPSGAVMQDTPALGEVSVLWTLQRVPVTDGRWRIAKVTSYTDQPPRP